MSNDHIHLFISVILCMVTIYQNIFYYYILFVENTDHKCLDGELSTASSI